MLLNKFYVVYSGVHIGNKGNMFFHISQGVPLFVISLRPALHHEKRVFEYKEIQVTIKF